MSRVEVEGRGRESRSRVEVEGRGRGEKMFFRVVYIY